MSNDLNYKRHSVSIDNRESMELSGIKDVPAFNEEEVLMSSDCGEVVVKGSGLKLEGLDLDSGIVKINGKITALIYNDKVQVKGFFKRAFS